MAAWNSFSYICTRALHSFRSFAHWCAASTVIPLLPKATFTPSIQPNLGLLRSRPQLTFAQPSTPVWSYGTHPFFPHAQTISILSEYWERIVYLNTLLPNSFSIPALLRTSSFLTIHSWHSNQSSQTLDLVVHQDELSPTCCLLHQVGVGMSSQIMHALSWNIHPFAHVLSTCT